MESSELKPGDAVIPLAGLVVTVSIISGSINAAVVAWKLNYVWWLPFVAFFVSGLVCWFISKKVGSFVFPATADGQVVVVKAGSSALLLTLKAAIIGAIISLLVGGLALAFLLGGMSLIASTWYIVAAISLVIGAIWGTLSALL